MALSPAGFQAFASSSKGKKKTSATATPTPESSETNGPASSDKPANHYPSLLIGPGDELEIYVVNFSSGNGYTTTASVEAGTKSQLPTNYLVDSDGMILFPFLGDIQLKDLTQIQAAKLMKQKLSEFITNPQVTVLVRTSNYYNVSVLGDVAKPGKFLIRGEPTIFSVLADAGGPLQDADLGNSLIIRGDTNKKEKINLDHYLKDRGFHETPPLVYPGDVLMVPKSGGIAGEDLAMIASIIASAALIATQIK
jgi:protein involved in polysaccharide export with SLBB domain